MKLQTTDHIYNSARHYYSDRLHYHNFSHIKETLNYAKSILKECDSKEITYDVKVVYHAILFHDAGYGLNHFEKGFKNKESYSAVLAENVLLAAGESKEHMEKVMRAILATHINGECQTSDDAIVRAADLSGLAAPYTDFMKNSIALFKEREYLSGEKISWSQYKKEVFDVIRSFLKQKIMLDIGLFTKSNYMFHAKVFHNLDNLMQEKID